MARTVDPAQHAARRDSILDAAAGLIAQRGYAATSVADILAAAAVSKGAFYHYFASKDEVLGGLVDRGLDRWASAADAALTGLTDPIERLRRLVEALALAKRGDRAVLVEAMPGLLADANAAMQLRLRRAAVARFLPMLQEIVVAGVADGAFRAQDPAASARVVLSLLQELSDVAAHDLLAIAQGTAGAADLEAHVRAYGDAIPAALGVDPAPAGFLALDGLEAWTAAARERRPGAGGAT